MHRKDFLSYLLTGVAGSILAKDTSKFLRLTEMSDDALIGKQNLQFKNENVKLRDEAYNEFLNMKKAATKDGIEISSVSAFRSFEHQKRIWNRKYKSYTSSGLSPMDSIKKIVEYSTMPGTSRHHWGTDIDLIDAAVAQPQNVLSPNHFEGSGVFSNFKQWMDENAEYFNFYLVYTNNPDRKGFKYEPWHYSYRPLSCQYLKLYRERNLYNTVTNSEIEGADHFTKIFIEQYYRENILDINPQLL